MSDEETTVRLEQLVPAARIERRQDSHVPSADAASGARARARRRRAHERNRVRLLRVGVVILLLAGMYLLNALFGNLTMPKPHDVITESWKMWTDGSMLHGLGQTLTVLSVGFLIAATTGVLGGILLGGFRTVGRVLDPFVNAINATPGSAFIPLIIVWFGLFTPAKVVVVLIAAVFPILISTAAGIDRSDSDLVEMARSFGASRARLFWQVMLPDAIPSILSGLRIGAAVAVVGTVVSEFYMAQSGLGGMLASAGNRFQMERYFAVIIVLMVLGSLITGALRLAELRLARWRVSLRDAR